MNGFGSITPQTFATMVVLLGAVAHLWTEMCLATLFSGGDNPEAVHDQC